MYLLRKSPTLLYFKHNNTNFKLLHNKNSNVFQSEPYEDIITNKTVVKTFKVISEDIDHLPHIGNKAKSPDTIRNIQEKASRSIKNPVFIKNDTQKSSSRKNRLLPNPTVKNKISNTIDPIKQDDKISKCKHEIYEPKTTTHEVSASDLKIRSLDKRYNTSSEQKLSSQNASRLKTQEQKSNKCEKKMKESFTGKELGNEMRDKNKSQENVDTEFRCNNFNIQLLSKSIHDQLFPNDANTGGDSKLIEKCLQELKVHHLPSELHKMEDISLKLPPIENGDIVNHFHKIGEEQAKPYRDLTLHLINTGIPDIPVVWEKVPGWTRYVPGKSPEHVEYPLEDAFVFDIEVCVKEGDMPTLATAVSTEAWYAWISPDLLEKKTRVGAKKYTTEKLIPFESNTKTTGHKSRPEFCKEKVVIGHNVSYDRARIKEQYWLTRTGLRFIDTLSMHVCVSGITRYQRSLLKSEQDLNEEAWSSVSSLNSLREVYKLYCEGRSLDKTDRDIFVEGSLEDIENNLQNLMTYCAKDTLATYQVTQNLFPLFLNRFPHPVTLAGMLELGTAYLPVNNNWVKYFHESCQTFDDLNVEMKSLLMNLCDEACTLLHEDKYKQNMWLWDQDWSVKDLKLKKTVSKTPVNEEDTEEADEFYEVDRSGNDHLIDDIVQARKARVEKFKPLMKTKDRLPANVGHLMGYPEWYRKLCVKPPTESKRDIAKNEMIQDVITQRQSADWIPGPTLISNSMQITPKLLSLTWKSLPLHFIRGQGWGYLVPYKTDIKVPNDQDVPLNELKKLYESINKQESCAANVGNVQENLKDNVETNISFIDCSKSAKRLQVIGDILDKKKAAGNSTETSDSDEPRDVGFIKLPHKDGEHLNVGNPLSRDFINKFSDNSLAGVGVLAKKIIEISRMLSYWRNNHERVKKQFVVWLNKKDLPKRLVDTCGDVITRDYGVILPMLIVSGTLTRRAVEATWMTASNAMDERVGSELRAMVQAPDGYSIIGADVDSQELWIASVIGDSYYAKEHGATPLGWMTLSGQKSNATDMHSITAKAVGISREHAKIINYARIYGAGERFAERLLKQFNPEMSKSEAKSKARKMYNLTKGKKLYKLKEGLLEELKKRVYSKYEAREVCAAYNTSFQEIFNKPQWYGGTESAMFNRLEEIATSLKPVTPFLDCRLSRALEPSSESDSKFIQTRVNWVVQSGAVDFLHLMLVCMRWLVSKDTRFVISIHDEIRYLVPDEEKYETALALHVTNLLTRAFCIRKLGMTDIPLSISFFSSVEIDKVLRKESHNDCKTPSNPYGLSKGYGIPLGETLDIYQNIEKANSVIGTFGSKKLNRKLSNNRNTDL